MLEQAERQNEKASWAYKEGQVMILAELEEVKVSKQIVRQGVLEG